MDARLVAIALGAFSAGAIFGASLRTETERSVRGDRGSWRPFLYTSHIAVILNAVLPVFVTAGISVLVCVTILRLAGAYPLSMSDRRLLGFCWLGGALLAKWARYQYWKPKKARW